MNFFRQIFFIFDRKDQWKLLLLLGVVISVSLLEAVGVGLIFPFIKIVSEPELIETHKYLVQIGDFLQIENRSNFIAVIGIALVFFYFTKNIYIGLSYYFQQKFIALKRAEITSTLFQYYLARDFTFHTQNNSAFLLRNLNQVDALFTSFIQPFFVLITETLTITFIVALLFLANAKVSLMAIAVIGIPAVLGNWWLSRFFKKYGKENFHYIGKTSQVIIDGFRGVRELKAMNRWRRFVQELFSWGEKLGRTRAKVEFLNMSPRLFFETVIIWGIVSILLFKVLTDPNDKEMFSLMALFGAASFRLMGSVNKILLALNLFHHASVMKDSLLVDIVEAKKDTKKIHPTNEGLQITGNIKVDGVFFSYPGSNSETLKNISFEIPRGKKVAFVGESGSGKTTLMNILIGLIDPSKGKITIDHSNLSEIKEEWQKKVGYIPQGVTLFDTSIKENIRFGCYQKSDDQHIQDLVKTVCLDDFVTSLDDGLDTVIGENADKVSGGQKQRLAIARALYNHPLVLFLDEATSALDNRTETDVVEAIEKLSDDTTVISIAHRVSSILDYDTIYFLKEGEIIDEGSFEGLLARNATFRNLVQQKEPSTEEALS